ncbi:NAD(P)H-hydrate epimerase [bacterium]|nr:NAD(P)H-hydrate epimerase [bacterium]
MIPHTMSRDEVRDVDQRAIEEFGLPGVVLMENAGRGCVDWLAELGVSGRVVICAGRGNNGGDGFVIARHLENRGINVLVLLFADPESLRGDAAINCRVLERAGTPVRAIKDADSDDSWQMQIASADWIIDALLGTGTRGSLRDPFPAIIVAINAASGRVFAIDLPSGLDCDTGEPVDTKSPLAVKAEFTATFVACKLGFENSNAAQFTGDIRVIDIGVPHAMFESDSK